MSRSLTPLLLLLPLALVATVTAAKEVITFEGLPEGQVVSVVNAESGLGPIGVNGSNLADGLNDKFPPGLNAAVIFDSACPDEQGQPGGPQHCSGEDRDLGTPHLDFGGPGKGMRAPDRGCELCDFPNRTALGKLLIVAEDLVDADGDGLIDDPDDEGSSELSRLTFDFSAIGPVTVHSVAIVDVNYTGPSSTIDLLDADGNPLGASPFELPRTEDNGVIPDLPLDDTAGVVTMVVNLRGSGAIDNLVFSPGTGIRLQKLTNGSDADSPEGDDIPWVPVGDPVEWTYLVENAGTEPLVSVAVTDDRGVEVSCPGDTLEPGATMTCTAAGSALAPAASSEYESVLGTCRGRRNRPLYVNLGSVTATGADSQKQVTASDPSHYCSDQTPAICVRKQNRGPDTRSFPSGSDVEFRIVVWNCGTMDLTDVKVADVLVPGCNAEFDRLAVGASRSYTCTMADVVVGGSYGEGCSFENEVVATGTGGERTVTDSDTSTVVTLDLEIDKRFQGGGEGGAGFEITVTNRGCDLEDVRVTDPLAPECARELGAMAAGDSRSYTCAMARENEACVRGVAASGEIESCAAAAFELPAGADYPAEGDEGEYGEGEQEEEGGEDDYAGEEQGDGDGGPSIVVLLLLAALLVAGGLFAWNRMKVG